MAETAADNFADIPAPGVVEERLENRGSSAVQPARGRGLWLSLCLVLWAVLFITPSLSVPFSSRGESREATVVTQMFDTGEVILPLRNGETIASKPPLFHWAAYGFSKVRGDVSELAVRLPSAFASLIAAIVLLVFCSRRLGNRGAAGAVFVLLTSSEWLRYSSVGRVDMVFSAVLFAAGVAGYRFVQALDNGSASSCFRRGFTLALLCALAVLAKGPAGAILPGLALGLYIVWNRGISKKAVGQILILAAVCIIGLLASLIWYVAAYQQGGDAFLKVQLVRENVTRLTGTDVEATGHSKPFWMALPLLLQAFLPWSLLLPAFVPLMVRLARNGQGTVTRPLIRYCFAWAAVLLFVIAVSSSKRSVYFLPVLPWLAIAWTMTMQSFFSTQNRLTSFARGYLKLLGTVLILGGLVALVVLSGLYVPEALADALTHWRQILPDFALQAVWWASFALLALGSVLWSNEVRRVHIVLGGVLVPAAMLVGHVVFPLVAEEGTARDFLRHVSPIIGESPVYQFRVDFYPAAYYLRREVPLIDNVEEISKLDKAFILVPEERRAELNEQVPVLPEVARSENAAAYGKGKLFLMLWERPGK